MVYYNVFVIQYLHVSNPIFNHENNSLESIYVFFGRSHEDK